MKDSGMWLEILNLGRCIENPDLLEKFVPEDWTHKAHRELFIDLTTLPTTEARRNALSQYLVNLGVNPIWTDFNQKVGDACTESQKMHAVEVDIAVNGARLIEDLRERRYMGDTEAILSAIDRLKGVVEGYSDRT